MESFNAIYIEPQSLEQSLLNPNPSPKVLTNDPESTTTPLPNKDIDLSGTDVTPGLVEKPELKEIEDNPKTTNESENSIENRGVQYTDDIELPSSYVDPGSGGKGPGASSEFETNI